MQQFSVFFEKYASIMLSVLEKLQNDPKASLKETERYISFSELYERPSSGVPEKYLPSSWL